jgi:hypothetical protein
MPDDPGTSATKSSWSPFSSFIRRRRTRCCPRCPESGRRPRRFKKGVWLRPSLAAFRDDSAGPLCIRNVPEPEERIWSGSPRKPAPPVTYLVASRGVHNRAANRLVAYPDFCTNRRSSSEVAARVVLVCGWQARHGLLFTRPNSTAKWRARELKSCATRDDADRYLGQCQQMQVAFRGEWPGPRSASG